MKNLKLFLNTKYAMADILAFAAMGVLEVIFVMFVMWKWAGGVIV